VVRARGSGGPAIGSASFQKPTPEGARTGWIGAQPAVEQAVPVVRLSSWLMPERLHRRFRTTDN